MTAFLKLPPLHPERAIEWLEGGLLISWGLMVLMFPDMFESQLRLYQGLLSIFPQPVWGVLAFGGGLLRLGALYVNGNHYRTPYIRVATGFLSMLIWFCVSVGLFRLGIPQMDWGVYPILLLGDLWSVFRASSDAYESSDIHRKLKAVTGGMKGARTSR